MPTFDQIMNNWGGDDNRIGHGGFEAPNGRQWWEPERRTPRYMVPQAFKDAIAQGKKVLTRTQYEGNMPVGYFRTDWVNMKDTYIPYGPKGFKVIARLKSRTHAQR